MSLFMDPNPAPLTEQEKLQVALLALNQRIPVGMPLCIEGSIVEVRRLFTEQELPLREELIAELSVWRTHAQEGFAFAERCDHMVRGLIRAGGRW